jgi:alginate O-acetyltransferase complex protein AlgI
MPFNSLPFVAFFCTFFLIYWCLLKKNLRFQNLLILAGSYFFYAWWDWRFLLLLIGSTVFNYVLGAYIEKSSTDKQRRSFLYLGLFEGIGTLLYFKYCNFFITSFVNAFAKFHITLNGPTIHILLPLGISYYTFRTLSYIIDIYNGKIKSTSDWVVFFSYVAFFPSVLAGPIDKPNTLIPQLTKKREFNYAMAADGMRQILWGLFKKTVIADNCADITKGILVHYQNLPASSLCLAAFYFAIQVYADFSGYSDMAIGFAKLLGFNITRNFNYPFFSQNVAEFWRKWHISLTSWLTEYVFTPLSIQFRDFGKLGIVLAILMNFIIVGLWHGANWTFVLFGFINGCYFIPLILTGRLNRKKKLKNDTFSSSIIQLLNMLLTFILMMLTFVIFWADNIYQGIDYLSRLFSRSLFTSPFHALPIQKFSLLPLIFIFMSVEWIQRNKQFGLQIDTIKYAGIRWAIYIVMFALCLNNISRTAEFIYFKF